MCQAQSAQSMTLMPPAASTPPPPDPPLHDYSVSEVVRLSYELTSECVSVRGGQVSALMKHVVQQLRRDKALQRHKLLLDMSNQAPLHIKPGLTQVGKDCQCMLALKCCVLILSCHVSIRFNTTPRFFAFAPSLM